MSRKRNITIAAILAAAAIAAMAIYVLYVSPKYIIPAETYTEAKRLYDSGDYMKAALALESIGSYADSKKLSKDAWKLAGDVAYNEGKFDVASTCYSRGNAENADLERIDECYLALASNAFKKDMTSRGEIYLNCVRDKAKNADRIDEIRIAGVLSSIEKADSRDAIDSAIERLALCGESSYSKVAQALLEGGEAVLEKKDAEGAGKIFNAALRFGGDAMKEQLSTAISEKWDAAGELALSEDDRAFAELCFIRAGHPEKINGNDAPETGEGMIAAQVAVGGKGFYAVIDRSGKLILIGDAWTIDAPEWEGMKSIAVGKTPFILAIMQDGTVLGAGGEKATEVEDWQDIVAIACGRNYSLGLKSDGTVVASGADDACTHVSTWRDISAIAAGDGTSYGLDFDGTVTAVGEKGDGQSDVREWTDIKAISAGERFVVGLKKDGTVVACGDNSKGQCETDGWSDVVYVAAGGNHTVGILKDGTLVACGSNENGECEVEDIENVVAVYCAEGYTVAVHGDGTTTVIGKLG